jgi:FKBP-type peptidyl-prolyl cis-trans isomerase
VKTWFQSLGFHIQLVPLLVGYADVGESEIPPGATFKLEVELLEVRSSST